MRAAAQRWLDEVYGGAMVLTSDEPWHDDGSVALFGCRFAEQNGVPVADEPLTCTVAVPRNWSTPFHPAPDDPMADLADPTADRDRQPWRLNARGAVLVAHAQIDGARARPVPWQPAHESPGWWDRFLDTWFPGAQRAEVLTWSELIEQARARGRGTRAVIWVRRGKDGAELTGALRYLHHTARDVTVLDGRGVTGLDLGALVAEEVRDLRVGWLADLAPGFGGAAPWEAAVADLPAAATKAQSWLQHVYGPDVALVAPGPQDELARGWVFPCNTRRFLTTGDWQFGMLAATVVVPRDETPPFLLHYTDPSGWLARWDNNAPMSDLPAPPRPTEAEWLTNTVERVQGEILSVVEGRSWDDAMVALGTLPDGGQALVWFRRFDRRGRDTVGLVLVASRAGDQLTVADPATGAAAEPVADVGLVHVIRYR